MAIELSYVVVTPYSLAKSRTGGILSRLLSRTDLELIAAQILTLTSEMAEEYAESIKETVGERDKEAAVLFHDYILENMSPLPNGKRQRCMLLLFQGEDACRKLFEITGGIISPRTHTSTGTTIRDTYADLVLTPEGDVRYFEPAVLTPPCQKNALKHLNKFAQFAKEEPNVIQDSTVKEDTETEQTLVIIKPDNWRFPSTKPGNVIDILSRTGLRIVGCKIYKMPLSAAKEFYGPVQGVLREKLAPVIGEKAKTFLEDEFNVSLPSDAGDQLTQIIGKAYADDQFYQIIEFMSGHRPDTCKNVDEEEGDAKCMVLIYEGVNAISKIRDILGPTDPNKAPSGTVRRDFGHNIMINTAHASDSPESVIRETGIIRINNNPLSNKILNYLNNK